MKNLDLNKYGVLEMNAGEMIENDGGLLIGTTKKIPTFDPFPDPFPVPDLL